MNKLLIIGLGVMLIAMGMSVLCWAAARAQTTFHYLIDQSGTIVGMTTLTPAQAADLMDPSRPKVTKKQ